MELGWIGKRIPAVLVLSGLLLAPTLLVPKDLGFEPTPSWWGALFLVVFGTIGVVMAAFPGFARAWRRNRAAAMTGGRAEVGLTRRQERRNGSVWLAVGAVLFLGYWYVV